MKQTDLIAFQHVGNIPNGPLGGETRGRLEDARQALALGAAVLAWWRRTFRRYPSGVERWLVSPTQSRDVWRVLLYERETQLFELAELRSNEDGAVIGVQIACRAGTLVELERRARQL